MAAPAAHSFQTLNNSFQDVNNLFQEMNFLQHIMIAFQDLDRNLLALGNTLNEIFEKQDQQLKDLKNEADQQLRVLENAINQVYQQQAQIAVAPPPAPESTPPAPVSKKRSAPARGKPSKRAKK